MNFKRFSISILLVLIVFCSLSSVFAEDNATDADINELTSTGTIVDNVSGADDSHVLSITNDSAILSDSAVDDSRTMYISTDGVGDGSTENNPSNWSQAKENIRNHSIDTVVFLDGNYNITDTNLNVDNLTLKALNNGKATLDAKNSSSFFINVHGSNLNLIGLNFINDIYTDSDGGALIEFLSSHGKLFIDYCNFSSLNSKASNGIIYTQYASVLINNSCFRDISLNSIGGIMYVNGEVTIDNSTFNNISNGNRNAAVAYANDAINVNNSIFTNIVNNVDSSRNNSGAVFYSISSGVNLINSVFTNISSRGSAGVAHAYSSSVINNTNFTNIKSDGEGGVLFVYKGSAVVDNSNINYINTTGYGGAIYAGIVNISNSNFDNIVTINEGGAVYGTGVNINNSTFNNVSSARGGAVYAQTSITVYNSNFTNTKAGSAGALYARGNISGANVNIINSSATSQYGIGGAIQFTDKGILDNFNFTNVSANYSAGAIIFQNNLTLTNSNFINSSANSEGGAIYNYIGSGIIFVNNTSFINSTAGLSGGAIYIDNVYGNGNVVVLNSSFVDSNASARYGGAIMAFTGNLTVNDSSFINSYAGQLGGAISTLNDNTYINNSTFTNSSSGFYGGAVCSYGSKDIFVSDSIFTNSSAGYDGGAIYERRGNIYVNDSDFINSSAKRYGGVICNNAGNTIVDNFTSENSDAVVGGAIKSVNVTVNNSNIINSTAVNGAVHAYNGIINNSVFNGSTAFDGAVVDCNNLTITNNQLINNTARTRGIIYGINVTADNLSFTDNNALDNILIYILNDLNGIDTDSTVIVCNSTYAKSNGKNNVTGLVDLGNNVYGVYIQRTLTQANEVYIVNDRNLIRNQYTGEDISGYLKILLMKYGTNSSSNVNLQDIAYVFSDGDYLNSDNETVKDVIATFNAYSPNNENIGDSNVTYDLGNGTTVIANFFTGGNAAESNLFTINYTYVDTNYNLTVNKTPVNSTVLNGTQAVFNITVNNTGNTYVYNIIITEDSYGNLIFDHADYDTNWTEIVDESGKHMWTYIPRFDPGDISSILVYFNTTGLRGNYTNSITVSSSKVNKIANGTVTVLVKNLTGKMTCNNTPVLVGNRTVFTVNVSNNGDVDLDNVSVNVVGPDGLVLVAVDGNFTDLKVGESQLITLTYNTTVRGNFTPIVNITNPGVNELTLNDTVEVLVADLTVSMDCVDSPVLVGNRTVFTVNVSNNGDVDLDDVNVAVVGPDGLVLVAVDGNFTDLKVGESKLINLTYNTTVRGNFTPVAVVTDSDVIGNRTADAGVEVLVADLTVSMDCVDSPVLVGNKTVFVINVTNVGDVDLDNVSVNVVGPDGLVLDGVDGNFTDLKVGESKLITLTYNTTAEGNFTPVVNITQSDVLSETTANDTVEVLKPDYYVDISPNNSTIFVGNETTFTITVTNNGSAVLNNITVVNDNVDGLLYNSFNGENWTYTSDNNRNTWTYNGSLNPGESISFNVTYTGLKKGNYSLLFTTLSNETDNNITANHTVNVLTVNNTNNSNNTNNNSSNNTNNSSNSQNSIAGNGCVNSSSADSENNSDIPLPETGNEIYILIIVIIIILCAVVLYRRKQN